MRGQLDPSRWADLVRVTHDPRGGERGAPGSGDQPVAGLSPAASWMSAHVLLQKILVTLKRGGATSGDTRSHPHHLPPAWATVWGQHTGCRCARFPIPRPSASGRETVPGRSVGSPEWHSGLLVTGHEPGLAVPAHAHRVCYGAELGDAHIQSETKVQSN